MNSGMLSVVALVLLVACSTIARGQSLESDSRRDGDPLRASGTTGTAGSSWESWLYHGEHERARESHLPPRRSDLGASNSSPSIEPASGPPGSDAAGSPSRFTLKTDLHGQKPGRIGREVIDRDRSERTSAKEVTR